MPLFHLGPAGDAFAGAFGGTAALLLIGGPILLRWQRNRHQFVLAQSALAQGITRFPKGQPTWLLSLRQGLSALTLGIALLTLGAVGFGLTRNPTMPAIAATQPAMTTAIPATPVPMLSDADPTGPRRPEPPQPDPAMDEWHRLKAMNTLSLMSLATGFVLALLGIMRIAFSATEKRYHLDEDPS